MHPNHVPVRVFGSDSAVELTESAGKLAAEYGTAAHPELVQRVPEFAGQLGAEIRNQCRPADPDSGLFVLTGLSVDDDAIGATPAHWSQASAEHTATWDVLLLLLASVMGRALGWEGQQDGKLVHNIVPSPGHEQEQTGMSSTVLLSPHTEDAFHPQRAHLLMLGCLRNHDEIGTHASCVRQVALNDTDRAVLSAPALPILPDDSYGGAQGYVDELPLIPTLWDREDGVCVRFDPAYTPLERADEAYRSAYGRLAAGLQRATTSVRLGPGDVMVIDNDTVVHGREPFQARYDGTDRWLKRVNIRVPGRDRPPLESLEDGYGQRVVDPYA